MISKGRSKSETYAKEILHRIHTHSLDEGGVLSLTTGAQGSAKTSTLLSFSKYTIKHHPLEKIFWSNAYNAPLQFVKIGKRYHNILVKEGSNVTFHDRDNKLAQLHPMITYFNDYDELYTLAEEGKLNAVFFGNRLEWMEFIAYLRSVGEWCHVYIDELSEVAPANQSGKTYKLIQSFANDLKEVRKCMMCVHTNTQATQDIDYRVRSKVMINIFLPGARASKYCRVSQGAIDNLNVDKKRGNEAWLEYSGKFGKTKFRDIFKPIPGVHWEARVNNIRSVI